jgi:hypothetical protein
MQRRTCLRLVAAAAWTVAAWVGTTDVSGVILYETAAPSANTDEPAGELAGSGWQFQGQFGNFLGTPIAPHFFITAKHIYDASSAIVFQGGTYTLVDGFYDPNSDLAIWQVAGTFPATAPLYTRADETGKALVVIGRGTQRGSEVSINSTLKGWAWGVSDAAQRWGENTVAQIVPLGAGYGDALYATFDAGAGLNEAHLSSGDSGGAVFIKDADDLWKLAGINYAVDGTFHTDAAGNGAFHAALFDIRGFYLSNPSPPPAYEVVVGDDPVASGFYATRISSKLPWIYSVIDPHGDMNRDGASNLIAYALGLDPGNPAAGKMPYAELNGSDLSLIYTRELSATDVTCAIERSPDLASWAPASPVNEAVSTVGTLRTIKAKVARETNTQLFLRLRVTRP